MNEDSTVLADSGLSLAQGEPPLVVGVDLGGTQMRAAVLRGSTLLSRVGELTGKNPVPERVIPRIFTLVQQALDEAHVSLEQVAGIGIAAPGPLDSRTGIVYSPPNLPGWDHVPLRARFEERFKVPVFVENDANAAGLGEYLFGAGRGSQNMVYMTISTGIGGGVISEGRIIEGASGTGGELGHMTIDWHGEHCNCGNIGCLERLSSGTGIAQMANKAIALGRGEDLLAFALTHEQDERDNTPLDEAAAAQTSIHINARTVALAAVDGIPLAQEIIAIAAEALGVGLVNIIHIFNPEVIILGGGVTLMGDQLLGPAKKIVQQRAMKAPREAVRIVLAQLGSDVGLVGAGSLIYYYHSLRQRENYGGE